MLQFTGERIVPGAANCEPNFAKKMYQEHIARYAFASAFAMGADVLDVGCGVGYGSLLMANSGASSVVALDIAEDAISHARSNYFHPKIHYKICSANAFDFPESFDLVVCFELIEHVKEQIAVIDNISRALRPNGVFVISTPRPLDNKRTHFHEHELHFEEIHQILRGKFKHVRAFFENNYFTSFIGAEKPSGNERIVEVTNNFGLNTADYFIFLATNGHENILDLAQPIMSVNDDSYVVLLEKDVKILHKAEDDARDKIRELERKLDEAPSEKQMNGLIAESERQIRIIKAELGAERARLESTSVQLEIEKKEAKALESQIAQKTKDLAAERARIENISSELEIVRSQLAIESAEAESLRTQIAQQEDTIERTRVAIATTSSRLVEAETKSVSERLSYETRISELAREYSLRETELINQRMDAEARHLAVWQSTSWQITRPMRGLMRLFLRMKGGRG